MTSFRPIFLEGISGEKNEEWVSYGKCVSGQPKIELAHQSGKVIRPAKKLLLTFDPSTFLPEGLSPETGEH